MLKGRIIADADWAIGKIDPRIFGTFVEHMGRCVYGGIFEPGHPTADENGLRQDVLDLTRELGVTIVRYPGGNFLSGYNWEDGVGPRDQRPIKLDLAWGTTETNQFGTNEFMTWAKKAGVEPMFAVNLGTRGPDEARTFIEYCNHPGGTYWSDLRRSHGVEQPYDIKFWCLGNEMDGPWQICRKTAQEYGRVAQETAKVLRWVCDDLTLAACGSSHRLMPTYGAWEQEVLDICYDEVDVISLHQYFRNDENDVSTYFGVIDDLDAFIKEVARIADAAGAKRRSKTKIMLSLDEWNVWYKAYAPTDLRVPGFPEAPPLLEEIYNFEDALVVGGALCVLMNNADRVVSACLAQLVNVIGPIMTEKGGPAWRQTIFHPFAQAARLGRGDSLMTRVEAPTYSNDKHGDLAGLTTTVTHDPATGEATVFVLNRLSEPLELHVELRGAGERRLVEAIELHHADIKAVNGADRPDAVAPTAHDGASVDGHVLTAILKPLSWTVFVTARA